MRYLKTAILVFLTFGLFGEVWAQTSSTSSGELGKCQDIYSSDCENLYASYSAMDVAKLEQRFSSQDSSMSFDELSILKRAYAENRIKGTVSKKSGSVSSTSGEVLVTFARSCCVSNSFKTYGQFLNLIKIPVYGQADCLAAQTNSAKDAAVEAAQAAQVKM